MNSMREYFRLYLALSAVFLLLLAIGGVEMGIHGETSVAIGFYTLGLSGLSVMALGGLAYICFDWRSLLIPANYQEVNFLVDLHPIEPVLEPAVLIDPSLLRAVPPAQAAPAVHPYLDYRRVMQATLMPSP
jgi:hypothetical protein